MLGVMETFGVAGQKGMRLTQRHPEDSKITYSDDKIHHLQWSGEGVEGFDGAEKALLPNNSSHGEEI